MQPVKYYALIIGSALMLAGTTASAAIVDSKHDLGSANANAATMNTVSDTDETCVFCHTPHAASTTALPLWNKQLTVAPATVYSSTTIDGDTDFTGSTSMACLSCHDGTQAMDNIVNASGSGNYDATGGGATGLAYTWVTSPTASATGVLSATAITNLSTNLGDDHPVAVQYGGGGITTAASTAATVDPDFGQVGVARAGQPTLTTASIGGLQKWWFDTDADTKMDSAEIRLYTRTVATVEQPFVECASCHDPHKGENATFLRVANTSSAVCTACHSK